jgi:hypothetical protein
MVMVLFLLFITARSNLTLHVILGFFFIPLVIVHLSLNGKWLVASIKNLFSGKLNPKARYMLILVVGLMSAFLLCTFSGIVLYQRDDHSMHRRHTISAIAFVVLTILHAKVHLDYIKNYFWKKKITRGKGIDKANK